MNTKKLLASALSAAMVIGTVSVPAFADDDTTTATSVTVKTIEELNEALTNNATEIIVEGTIEAAGAKLSNVKNVVIKGDSSDGEDILKLSGAVGTHNSVITFSDLTMEWPNKNYQGLQHAAALTYNNCTIKGMPFLYAATEEFNDCTFEQTSSDAYNLWTYGAKEVTFNDCTFNSAGKSVLIYSESKVLNQTVNINNCKFNASKQSFGKAAIEVDSSLTTNGGYTVNIDDETTATGFATGSKSGNSLYNVKKYNTETGADGSKSLNTRITLGGEVIVPLKDSLIKSELGAVRIGDKYYKTLADAIIATKNMSEDDITIDCVPNADLGQLFQVGVTKNLTINGNGAYISSGNGTLSFDMPNEDATRNGDCTLTHDITVVANDVKGIGAWGTRNTEFTVNLEFNNCKDMFEVYLNGNKGTNNYKLNNCSFDGNSKASRTAVFSNTNGKIEVENTEFNNVIEPIKLNNKNTGETNLTVKNSTFKNCSVKDGTYQQYEAERSPIGVMTSGDGATANVTVDGCDFVYDSSNTPANGQIRIGTEEAEKTSTPNVTAIINNNKSDVKVNILYTDGTSVKSTEVPANTGATVTNAVTADTISLTFKQDNTDETLYNIVLSGDSKDINRFNAAEFKFALTTRDAITYEIAAADKMALIPQKDETYEFHFDGKDGVADTAKEITIGTVKFDGYGEFTFEAKEGKVTATTTADNLVTEFVVNGSADGKGDLKISEDENKIKGEFTVPTQKLTINVMMNHNVGNNAAAYQDMTVAISGGDLAGKTIAYKLGEETNPSVTNGVVTSYKLEQDLTQNRLYTVTVSGAGYRTARYTVTMTEDKTMNVWNNVMTNEITVVDDTKATTSFLAGEIVKDGIINIYDLSAVVAYFGKTMDTSAYDKFAKYDLNRDGKIDMMDISIVLTSWGK